MTAREVLAEIEQRAEKAVLPGTSVYRALDKTVVDNRALVAALRAVLDGHWCIEGGEECGYDGRSWPCPDYRAITEKLGGGA